jgi:hypothetical protein
MLRDFLPRRFAERVVAGWAIAVTGLMVLGWVTHAPGDLGVIVHPPRWYDTLVVVLTVVAALAGYVYGVEVDNRAGMARTGVLTGIAVAAALGIATHFGPGWALPKMSAYLLSEPTAVMMQVHNVTRGPRYFRFLCPYRITFSPAYTGGGGLCLDDRSARRLRGETLPVWGYGNGWATRVRGIGPGLRDG